MKVLSNIKRRLRQNTISWRYVLNAKSTIGQLTRRIPLLPACQSILATLNRDGIAVTTINSLVEDGRVFRELSDEVENLERSQHTQIEEARKQASDASSVGKKTFIHFLLGEKPVVDPRSVFARFALQSQILGIANA